MKQLSEAVPGVNVSEGQTKPFVDEPNALRLPGGEVYRQNISTPQSLGSCGVSAHSLDQAKQRHAQT